MILCVTLNPCLDKTLTVPAWTPGDSVRGTAVREVVGGKGNNVARALARLGRAARPVTFLGGAVGAHCEALLRDDDRLDPLVTPTAAPTREILTVRTEGTRRPDRLLRPRPGDHRRRGRGPAAPGRGGLDRGGRRGPDALRVEPVAGDPRALQRPDRPGPRAQGPRLPRHLRPRARRHLGLLARGDPAQPPRGRRAPPRRRRPTEADLFGLLDRWSRHGVALRGRHRRPEPGAGPRPRPPLPGHAADDRRRQPDRLGRLPPRRPGRRLARRPPARGPRSATPSPAPSPTPSSGTPARSTRRRSSRQREAVVIEPLARDDRRPSRHGVAASSSPRPRPSRA